MSDDPAVPMLFPATLLPAVLLLGAWYDDDELRLGPDGGGDENPRNDSGGGT